MGKKLTPTEEKGTIKRISEALKVPEEKISKWWERLSEGEKKLITRLSILGSTILPAYYYYLYHILQKSTSLATIFEKTMFPEMTLTLIGLAGLGMMLPEVKEEERGRSKKKLSGVV